MKRSQIDNIISQSISTAANLAVALPKWASWRPAQFQFGDEADGVKRQGLGWKVVDFGLGDFSNCGLVVLLLCNALTDSLGEPLSQTADNDTLSSTRKQSLINTFQKKTDLKIRKVHLDISRVGERTGSQKEFVNVIIKGL